MKKHFAAILLSFCMMLTFLPGKVFAYEVNIVGEVIFGLQSCDLCATMRMVATD